MENKCHVTFKINCKKPAKNPTGNKKPHGVAYDYDYDGHYEQGLPRPEKGFFPYHSNRDTPPRRPAKDPKPHRKPPSKNYQPYVHENPDYYGYGELKPNRPKKESKPYKKHEEESSEDPYQFPKPFPPESIDSDYFPLPHHADAFSRGHFKSIENKQRQEMGTEHDEETVQYGGEIENKVQGGSAKQGKRETYDEGGQLDHPEDFKTFSFDSSEKQMKQKFEREHELFYQERDKINNQYHKAEHQPHFQEHGDKSSSQGKPRPPLLLDDKESDQNLPSPYHHHHENENIHHKYNLQQTTKPYDRRKEVPQSTQKEQILQEGHGHKEDQYNGDELSHGQDLTRDRIPEKEFQRDDQIKRDHEAAKSSNEKNGPNQDDTRKPFENSIFGTGHSLFGFNYHNPFASDYDYSANKPRASPGFKLKEESFDFLDSYNRDWSRPRYTEEHPIAYAGGFTLRRDPDKDFSAPSIPDYVDFSSDDGVGHEFPTSTAAPSITVATPSFDPYIPHFAAHVISGTFPAKYPDILTPNLSPSSSSSSASSSSSSSSRKSDDTDDEEDNGTRQARKIITKEKRLTRKVLRKRKPFGYKFSEDELRELGYNSLSPDSLEPPRENDEYEDNQSTDESSSYSVEDENGGGGRESITNSYTVENGGGGEETIIINSYSVRYNPSRTGKAAESYDESRTGATAYDSESYDPGQFNFLKKRPSRNVDFLDYSYVQKNCDYQPKTECGEVRHEAKTNQCSKLI